MKVNTIKGSSYAITCTKACTVRAISNSGEAFMLILEAEKKGQYGFVAPTDAVEVSDEHALVIQIFKGASLGLPARSGIQPGGNVVQPGENVVLKNLTAEAGTFTGAVNANGGVRVPTPATTAQEALSYNAFLHQKATDEWELVKEASVYAIPAWITHLNELQALKGPDVKTSNVTINSPGRFHNSLINHLFNIAPASGISIGGINTFPDGFVRYLGDIRDYGRRATAMTWLFDTSTNDDVSVLIGSTAHSYNSRALGSACYEHPVHWTDWELDPPNVTDFRYPLLNNINGDASVKAARPAFQMAYYGRNYLGSVASRLIRGTNYGVTSGNEEYIWALIPPARYNDSDSTRFTIAYTDRQAEDDTSAVNRWVLFVDGQYTLKMLAGEVGVGHTASISTKVKAYDVDKKFNAQISTYGMAILKSSLPGSPRSGDVMNSVIMDGVVPKPTPNVTASATEAPAAGGNVILTVSSTLSEAIYVLNDTMNGHDPAAVWCAQSAEEIPAGGGQVTLTLAANTTGQPREVWAFVGHHYAQAAVVKINQSI